MIFKNEGMSYYLSPYSNMIEGVRLAVEKGVEVSLYCSLDPRAYLKKGMAWVVPML